MPTILRQTAHFDGSALVEAICVPPERIKEVWPSVSGRIHDAIERGGMGDFAEVEVDVLFGDALLWLAWGGHEIEAVAVTQINVRGGDKFCTIVACAGNNLERWQHLLGELESFAKSEGCKSSMICGRKGWQRLLPDYKVTRVVLEKELS